VTRDWHASLKRTYRESKTWPRYSNGTRSCGHSNRNILHIYILKLKFLSTSQQNSRLNSNTNCKETSGGGERRFHVKGKERERENSPAPWQQLAATESGTVHAGSGAPAILDWYDPTSFKWRFSFAAIYGVNTQFTNHPYADVNRCYKTLCETYKQKSINYINPSKPSGSFIYTARFNNQ
jgi:hypothetical protein